MNLARRATAALILCTMTVLGGAVSAPARAQDEPLPEGPAPEIGAESAEPGSAEPGTLPGGIDFGDNVIVDENGVRWTIDAETGAVQLNDPAVEPAVEETPGSGPEGTGDPTGAEGAATPGNASDTSGPADPAGAGDPDGASTPAGDGAGRSVLVYVSLLAALIATSAFTVVAVRRRRNEVDDLMIVEQPIAAPSRDGGLSDVAFVPGYDGAAEAGAYQAGGAAYAQYAAAATGHTPIAPTAQSSARERFSTLRENVVERAEKGLTDSGRAKPVARKLEAAGSITRPGEWLVMSIAVTIGALCFVTFFTNLFVGLGAAGLTAYGTWYRLTMQESRRQRRFADALPETLQLLAGGLRGGLSMMQALQNVSDEADEPTASEFQRLMTEARLGRDLAVSLRDLSRRMDSKDFDWVVTAIEIHREVGGDLSLILDRVGNTIRSRNRVLGQVKALSAEGKLSGLILFMLPPGMLAAISVLNPEYLDEMIGDSAGQILLAVAAVLLAIGGWWLKKLSEFTY